jgi:(p)ppGpp synthase/HD superfamily hydrolase
VHNLHSCSPELKHSIDAHAARLESWGVARASIDRARDAAVIVASLTEDGVLSAALLAQLALNSVPDESREIELHFGPEAKTLAKELAHFGDIRLTPVAATTHHLEPAQAEALRKMLLSVVSDPRLVLARGVRTAREPPRALATQVGARRSLVQVPAAG